MDHDDHDLRRLKIMTNHEKSGKICVPLNIVTLSVAETRNAKRNSTQMDHDDHDLRRLKIMTNQEKSAYH